MHQTIRAFLTSMLFYVLFGVIYPLIVYVVSQFLFYDNANGSLVLSSKGEIIGSLLIGQKFSDKRYFHGRPSAAGNGYDGQLSGARNLPPYSKQYIDSILSTAKDLQKNNLRHAVPTDLVSYSASGLDPDISIDAAYFQARRVAKARAISADDVYQLINNYKEQRIFGIMGQERVNVLKLNLALDGYLEISYDR